MGWNRIIQFILPILFIKHYRIQHWFAHGDPILVQNMEVNNQAILPLLQLQIIQIPHKHAEHTDPAIVQLMGSSFHNMPSVQDLIVHLGIGDLYTVLFLESVHGNHRSGLGQADACLLIFIGRKVKLAVCKIVLTQGDRFQLHILGIIRGQGVDKG